MKFGAFALALIMNFVGLYLSEKYSGLFQLFMPMLCILAGILIITMGKDSTQKGLGWWTIWGTLAIYPAMIIVMMLSGVTC